VILVNIPPDSRTFEGDFLITIEARCNEIRYVVAGLRKIRVGLGGEFGLNYGTYRRRWKASVN